MKAVSYTSRQGSSVLALPREAYHLFRAHGGEQVEGRVAGALRHVQAHERLIVELGGFELRGRRILDVGAGQRLEQMVYFSQENDVVGIDLDVVAHGADPRPYWRMLRANGPKRTTKTVGRKLLRVDAAYRRALVSELGLTRYPDLTVLQMDAAAMTFPDESFDVVYSASVFSHLPDPAVVLEEMARVLKPGGVALNNFLLYSSRTGCMDLRVLGGRDADVPLWAHLRPEHRDLVRESAYLNRIRLPEWRSLFDATMPGCVVTLEQYERELLEPEAERLWGQGELLDYGRDELLTAVVTAGWRKP